MYAPAVYTGHGEDRRTVTPAESREDPECLKHNVHELCSPQTNITMERHKFYSRNQKPGETIETYVSGLKNNAQSCRFGDLQEELIRDRLVCGILNDGMRKLLLHDNELTLVKAIEICQIHELTDQHTKTLAGPKHNLANVDSVQQTVKKKPFRTPKPKLEFAPPQILNCINCGGNHEDKRE